jgi:hypothetical protein
MTFAGFERNLQLATAGLEPKAIAAQLAAFARAELAKAIQSGAASPPYETIVNGRIGASEDTVIPPGPIVYQFHGGNLWPSVIGFALDYLKRRSPKDSGDYQNSFVVIAGGRVKAGYHQGIHRRALLGGRRADADIKPTERVIITNIQPYTRKVEVGGMKMRVPPGLFKDTESAIEGEFGEAVNVRTRFLKLHAGVGPGVPYILKGHQRQIAAKQNRQSSAFRAGRATLSDRKDSKAGQQLTYPSLVLTLNID